MTILKAKTVSDNKVTAKKAEIAKLRAQMSESGRRSQSEIQIILDKISVLNHEIEEMTKKEKKVVPVMNAPTIASKRISTNRSINKKGHSSAVASL